MNSPRDRTRHDDEFWQEIKIPSFCERLIGFSIPNNQEILVVSYEGTHIINLAQPVSVSTDNEYALFDLYDPDTGYATHRGTTYPIVGLQGGEPLLQAPQGELIALDTQAESLQIRLDAEVVLAVKYENFSGDWAVATFSTDGRYVVLGCPYDFDFRVWERVVRNT